MSLVHVAGHPALDYLGTLSERGTGDQEELLGPEVLAAWFVDAGIVTVRPVVDAADLERGRELREHLFDVLTAWMDGGQCDDMARSAVNAAAALPPPPLELLPDGEVRVRGELTACLAAVARSALQLMIDVEPPQVRWCADDRCTHPFLDTSRAQARRWCDMSTCGTRNKQREHRARHRETG